MSKVFDEKFYTDDFDQEMIDYLLDSGWGVKGDTPDNEPSLNQSYLKYGSSNKYFWTSNDTYGFTQLTKQEFKEKVGMTTGYKLADGTYSSEYKIGDKFEVVGYEVSGRNPSELLDVGQVVVFEYDDHSHCPRFKALNGDIDTYEDWICLKPYKKQFTKSDLSDGMRVVYREEGSGERVIFEGNLYKSVGVDLEYRAPLCDYHSELIHMRESGMDIVKVTDRDGTVLFTREEPIEPPTKSPAQIELDKLQEQIVQLQEQANKLQETL